MRVLSIVSVLLLTTLEVFAQPGPPPPDPDQPVPFQGLAILIAAGAALGIKKLKDHRNSK